MRQQRRYDNKENLKKFFQLIQKQEEKRKSTMKNNGTKGKKLQDDKFKPNIVKINPIIV